MCIPQCEHIEITQDLIDQAEIDAKNIKQQKGANNKSTINMVNNHDIIGSIAQNVVFRYFEQNGILIEETPYFDKSIHKDKCDFEHRGLNDVKGSPAKRGWKEIRPYTSFLLSDHQRAKKVDWYTFVRLDMDDRIAHIAGVISYQDFLDKSVEATFANLKSPCHYIEAKHLEPMRRYAFGI